MIPSHRTTAGLALLTDEDFDIAISRGLSNAYFTLGADRDDFLIMRRARGKPTKRMVFGLHEGVVDVRGKKLAPAKRPSATKVYVVIGETGGQGALRVAGHASRLVKATDLWMRSDRYIAFMAATKGVDAHTVARALSKLTPGLNWRRCSRGHMAQEYARAGEERAYSAVKALNLEKLQRTIEALK